MNSIAALKSALAEKEALWREEMARRLEVETELKALQRAYTILTLHVENSPLAVIEWDAQFCIRRWSSRAEQMFGWRADEVIGLRREDLHLVLEEDEDQVRTVTGQMMEGSASCTFSQNRNYTRDGDLIDCEWYNSALRDDSGQIISVLSLVLDVTERKQSEEKLRKSEANLAAAQRVAHIGSWEFDIKTQTQVWSEELFRIYGLDPVQPAPTYPEMLRFIHPEDQLRIDQQNTVEQCQEKGLFNTFEHQLIRPDGTIRHVEVRGEGIRDRSGQLVGLFGTVLDITDRKQAELALRESEARFRAVFEQAAVGITLADCQSGQYLRVNRRFCAMVGYVEEELLHLTWQDITHPDDLEVNVLIDSPLYDGEISSIAVEKRYIRKDGTFIWVTITLSIVRNAAGLPLYDICVLEDISERKRVEAERQRAEAERERLDLERQQAEQQLRTSLEEKELLLKEVHHRVKNNLQVISSLFSLQSQYIVDPGILAVLTESQNRIHSMALIHEKLYQSHSLANIDFTDYIQTLTGTLFASYNTSPQLIHLNLQISDVALNLDAAIRCGLIISELVSNALKHAFPIHHCGEICLTFSKLPDGQLNLTVQDTGVGLPAEFDIQHTNSLGLRLVRTLVRKMKGNLEIFNQNGAVFQITFPHSELLLSSFCRNSNN